MDVKNVSRVEIYPSIGIARLGSSPEEYFIGPESPGHIADPGGSYKDKQGRIKRQAARFRVYGFDAAGACLGEILAAAAEIEWTVHLANRKAAFKRFAGRFHPDQPLRNSQIQNTPQNPHARDVLVIDPGPRTISGRKQSGKAYHFDGGTFLGLPVPLGEIRTDDAGRLLVLGGFGKSASATRDNPLRQYANNDGWHDDTSDGPVTAKVKLYDGRVLEAKAARVLCAPPKYAPEFMNIVSLYETISEVTVNGVTPFDKNRRVSFSRDIYPILSRAASYQWINRNATRGHGPGKLGDLTTNPYSLDIYGPVGAERPGHPLLPPSTPNLVAAGTVGGALHFVIYGGAGQTLLTGDESQFPDKAARIAELKKRLERDFTAREKDAVKRDDYSYVHYDAYSTNDAGERDGVIMELASIAGVPLGPGLLSLASNEPKDQVVRKAVFDRVRNPELALDSPEAKLQANLKFMPPLGGDDGDPREGDPKRWLKVLPGQYGMLRKWEAGDFLADWAGEPEFPTLQEIPLGEQPAALTRAALDPCVGGPFYPGIEVTYVCQDPALWSEPFRFRDDIEPGGVTQYMACPWQADFAECADHWWPAQRPDDVIPESEYLAILAQQDGSEHQATVADQLAQRVPWARGFDNLFVAETSPRPLPGDDAMVQLWDQLGFIVSRRPTDDSPPVYVETERAPYLGVDIRDYYYMLCNIDSYTDFLPTARKFVDDMLAATWAAQKEPGFPDYLRYFHYTPEAFETRLLQIYDDLVAQAEVYNPAADPIFRTREDLIQRIVQMAPFNQNDGAWIRSATPAGPLDEVQSLLFGIWMDEAGDGNVQWGHCNLYSDLLHSVGVYLPDVRSKAYAQDPRFLDSAFTVPALEMAISQFSQAYFPELLGFTLQLEWTVPSLKPTIKLFEYFGLDPHFYVLHVGIDNATSGHGAQAKRAVMLYLDRLAQAGGPQAVEAAWRRIWGGFIAFANAGTFGTDLNQRLQNPPSLDDQVDEIILLKREFGSLNHGPKQLGPNRIDDLFDDPGAFRQALIDAGYIVKGDPENSPFFQKTGFDGPMFKVFTDAQLDVWRAWVRSLAAPTNGHRPDASQIPVFMADAIQSLLDDQEGTPGHIGNVLKGPDPANPSQSIEKPVNWWFEQVALDRNKAIPAMMAALSLTENGWIVKGDPENSLFVTQLLAPAHPMGKAFTRIAPGSGGMTWREIAIAWIRGGCLLPKPNPGTVRAFTLQHPPKPDGVFPRQRIFGMGCIH